MVTQPTKSKSLFELIKVSLMVTLLTLLIFAVFTYFQLSLQYVLKHLSTLIEHIQNLEILYEFDARFHTKARKSNLSCFTYCTKLNTHWRALLFIDNRQFIGFLHKQN